MGIESQIEQFFLQIAYQPHLVYLTVVMLMVASSFGFPMPEEVTLVSAGFLAFMAMNPSDFPPPEPGAKGVNVHTMALVCFLAVVLSDYLIYWLGKKFGFKILMLPGVSKYLTPHRMKEVEKWAEKRAFWAPAAFRFMPGIRFPGHFTCGTLNMPLWRFALLDGGAALISVPTQVYLVAYYGKPILEKFKEFQITILAILAVGIVLYLVSRFYLDRKTK